MATPHDRLAKAVFSQLEHARAQLSAVAGTPEELDIWAERVLPASTLDELFER